MVTRTIVEEPYRSCEYEQYLGKRITVFCCRYIYAGKLVSVYDNAILLSDTKIVYETGAFDTPEWKDAQKLPNHWMVSKSAVESFGELKQ